MVDIFCPDPQFPAEAQQVVEEVRPQQNIPENLDSTKKRSHAYGKKRFFIDSKNYAQTSYFSADGLQGITPFHHKKNFSAFGKPWRLQDGIEDRFRYMAQSFWGESGEIVRYFNGGLFSPETLNRNPELRSRAPFSVWLLSQPMTSDLQGGFLSDLSQKHKIQIRAGEEEYFASSGQDWVTFIEGGQISSAEQRQIMEEPNTTFPPLFRENINFQDHFFELQSPLMPKEIKKMNESAGVIAGSVKPVYNFYIQSYENVLSQVKLISDLKEQMLPSLYTFIFETKNEILDTNQTSFRQHITLMGDIKSVFKDQFLTNDSGRITKVDVDQGEYFDNWAKVYSESRQNITAKLSNSYKLQIFPSEEIRNLKDYSNRSSVFPMKIEVDFDTDRSTFFPQVMRDTKFETPIIRSILEMTLPDFESRRASRTQVPNPQDFPQGPKATQIRGVSEDLNWQFTSDLDHITEYTDTLDSNGNISGRRYERQPSVPTKTLNLEKWWSAYQSLGKDIFLDTSELRSVTFDLESSDIFEYQDNELDFSRALYSLIFSGKLRALVKDKMRTFREIMDGVSCYHETVFYKISKFRITSAGLQPRPIQEFFFSNDSQTDLLKFVDTQVAYGEQYRYDIKAYELVIGNKYFYEPVSIRPNGQRFVDGLFAEVFVTNRPCIKIFEVPYMRAEASVLDKPPLPPDVNLVPYKGISNKLRLEFSQNSGLILADEIPIESNEYLLFEEIRKNQDIEEGAPIEFGGDDVVKFFEIFRTTKKPTSYRDFKGKSLGLISTSYDLGTNQFAGSATFNDTIAANTKYYYCFRAIDVHDHLSNPTPVFEVEMVNESGVTYPVIRNVDFFKLDTKEKTKKFRKYIRIQAAAAQIELDPEQPGFLDALTSASVSPRLGTRAESLFGNSSKPNKFKIRITSKQTGKKIDLNVGFVHEHHADRLIKNPSVTDDFFESIQPPPPGSVPATVERERRGSATQRTGPRNSINLNS